MSKEASTGLTPAGPLLVAELFPDLGRELVALLRALAPADWRRPTVCPRWSVHDVAAHLLDTALRRLSAAEPGFVPPPPARPISSYAGLVAFLNELNGSWVEVFRRLGPGVITDLLADAEPRLAAHMAGLDPWAPAVFSVAWAGEAESTQWFDTARELTERWHHQQQIRLAVGAPPVNAPRFVAPVLATFVRALPPRYAGIEAPPGTAVTLEFQGVEPYRFTLCRAADGWSLWHGAAALPAATVILAEEPAWLLLTKGMAGDAARHLARIDGDERLVAPVFATLAVMA